MIIGWKEHKLSLAPTAWTSISCIVTYSVVLLYQLRAGPYSVLKQIRCIPSPRSTIIWFHTTLLTSATLSLVNWLSWEVVSQNRCTCVNRNFPYLLPLIPPSLFWYKTVVSSSGQVHLLLHFILIRFHTTLLAACSCHWWVGYHVNTAVP